MNDRRGLVNLEVIRIWTKGGSLTRPTTDQPRGLVHELDELRPVPPKRRKFEHRPNIQNLADTAHETFATPCRAWVLFQVTTNGTVYNSVVSGSFSIGIRLP